MVSSLCSWCTLGPAHNEHPATTSRFLFIKITYYNVKKFGYNEHPLITSSFFCMFLLVVSGTQCRWNSSQNFHQNNTTWQFLGHVNKMLQILYTIPNITGHASPNGGKMLSKLHRVGGILDYPTPPLESEILMARGSPNTESQNTLPPKKTETPHGGLWDFGSVLTQNTSPFPKLELLMEDWCVETTAVFPEDTVSLSTLSLWSCSPCSTKWLQKPPVWQRLRLYWALFTRNVYVSVKCQGWVLQ